MNDSGSFGTPFILFVQSMGSWLSNPMLIISFLGSENLYLLMIPAVYWCFDSRVGIRMGMLLIISGAINTALKVIFHLPRPYWVDQKVNGLSSETSFGLPSGHAQLAASVWGYVIYNIRPMWAKILIGLLIFLIGISRMVLGVHFLGDVLAGWVIGLIVLLGFILIEKTCLGWLKSQSFKTHIFLSLSLGVIMFLITLIPTWYHRSWEMPGDWVGNARMVFPNEILQPFSLDTIITTCGTWVGLSCGYAWVYRQGGFSTEGSGGQRIMRYLVGIAGLLILWGGLGLIFPHAQDTIGYILRFLRYTILGVWISAIAPWLFLRLKLLPPSENPTHI